jgi:hypothetical protein
VYLGAVYLAKQVDAASARGQRRRGQRPAPAAYASPRAPLSSAPRGPAARAGGADARGAARRRQVSVRNQLMVLFDWVKTSLFGRDLSRF